MWGCAMKPSQLLNEINIAGDRHVYECHIIINYDDIIYYFYIAPITPLLVWNALMFHMRSMQVPYSHNYAVLQELKVN